MNRKPNLLIAVLAAMALQFISTQLKAADTVPARGHDIQVAEIADHSLNVQLRGGDYGV